MTSKERDLWLRDWLSSVFEMGRIAGNVNYLLTIDDPHSRLTPHEQTCAPAQNTYDKVWFICRFFSTFAPEEATGC